MRLRGGYRFRTYLSLTSHNGTWKDATRMDCRSCPWALLAPHHRLCLSMHHRSIIQYRPIGAGHQCPQCVRSIPQRGALPDMPLECDEPPKTANYARLNLYNVAPTLLTYKEARGAKGASPENTKETCDIRMQSRPRASHDLVQLEEFSRHPDHQRSQNDGRKRRAAVSRPQKAGPRLLRHHVV